MKNERLFSVFLAVYTVFIFVSFLNNVHSMMAGQETIVSMMLKLFIFALGAGAVSYALEICAQRQEIVAQIEQVKARMRRATS